MIEPTDFSAREQINCVRCLRCKPLPETDLRNRNTVIFCEKMQTRRIVNLFGCLVANPNYEQKFIGKLYRPQAGDKSRSVTPLELLYLKAHYPRTEYAELIRVIGRNYRQFAVTRINRPVSSRSHQRQPRDHAGQRRVFQRRAGRIYAERARRRQMAATIGADARCERFTHEAPQRDCEGHSGARHAVRLAHHREPSIPQQSGRANEKETCASTRRRCILRTELARIYEEKNSHKPQTYQAIIDCFADSKTGGKPKICLRDLRHEDDFETIVACHIWTDLPNDFVVPRGHVIEFRAWVRCYDRSGNSGLFDYTLSGMRQVRDLGLFEVTI